MTDAERSTCEALSHFLHAAGRIGAFGMLLSAGTLLLAARHPASATWVAAALLLGAIERLLALRVRFDARLFASMAHGTLPDLNALDHALHALGWARPPSRRPLSSRVRGAQVLVLKHATAVAVQGLLIGLLAAKGWT